VLESESVAIDVAKPGSLTNRTLALIVAAGGETALAVAFKVAMTRFEAKSGVAIAVNGSIRVGQPSISAFGLHIEWRATPPAETWHADLDGSALKYVNTSRYEFAVRLACDRGEQSCAADGDVITTTFLQLASPQNSSLRSEVSVLTRVAALVSCNTTLGWVTSAGFELGDSVAAESPIEVRLQARDVDNLEVKFTRAAIELQWTSETGATTKVPFNTESGSSDYDAVISGAWTKEPGRYTLLVRASGPTGNGENYCTILRRSITVAADKSKLTLGLAIGLPLLVVAVSLAAWAWRSWRGRQRSEAQVLETWRRAQFAVLERLFRNGALEAGSVPRGQKLKLTAKRFSLGQQAQLDCQAQDKFGYLPLHIAAACLASDEMLEWILSANPDGRMCTDRKGNLPIHLALHTIERTDGLTLEPSLRVARKLFQHRCESVVKCDQDGRLPIQLVVDSPACTVLNAHAVELVKLLGLPFSCVGEASNWMWLLQHSDGDLAPQTSVTRHELSSPRRAMKAREREHNAAANGTELIDVLLDYCDESGVWTVEQLAHATDKQGRDALSLANTGNRKRLWKRLLLLGRYMKLETLHQSATSVVIRVEDKEVVDGPPPLGARLLHQVHGMGRLERVDLDEPRGKPYFVIFDNGESHHYSAASMTKMKVVDCKPSMLALKRMTNEDEFQREIGFRAEWALSPEFVVAITSVHASERVFTMPCAECSLFGAISKEHFAGIDQFTVVTTARSLAKCIQHVHSLGIAHCDLKPRNFVRIGGNWKLIDFDAACLLGARAGMKYSTAYAPPELVRLLFRPMVTASELRQKISAKQLECDGETSTARRREYELQIVSIEKQLALVERIEANGIELMERTIEAHATFDVWSFGVIMYHLLTGGQLFFRCVPSTFGSVRLSSFHGECT
jgi:hypothetical protein